MTDRPIRRLPDPGAVHDEREIEAVVIEDSCDVLDSWQRDRHGPLADGTPYDLTFQFEMIGYNFEPSEIGAAYAVVQLEKLGDSNGRRQHNWARLHDLMGEHEDRLARPATAPDTRTFMVWSGNILRHPAYADIECRVPADGLPHSDAITERALSLPAHHALSSDDVGYMVEVVGEELARR